MPRNCRSSLLVKPQGEGQAGWGKGSPHQAVLNPAHRHKVRGFPDTAISAKDRSRLSRKRFLELCESLGRGVVPHHKISHMVPVGLIVTGAMQTQ